MKTSKQIISSRTKKFILFSSCYIVLMRCMTLYISSLSVDLKLDLNDLVSKTDAPAAVVEQVDSIRI